MDPYEFIGFGAMAVALIGANRAVTYSWDERAPTAVKWLVLTPTRPLSRALRKAWIVWRSVVLN